VRKVVKCPYCGYEGEFKLLKTWKYSWWNVYFYECPRCNGRFRWQVDPRGIKKSFTIRLGARGKGKSA
jgi:DNA-directed RNA polymerase subunit RPC12/RpoP